MCSLILQLPVSAVIQAGPSAVLSETRMDETRALPPETYSLLGRGAINIP